MYDQPYFLYLYVKMRQKELLEQAEQARLIKLAHNKRPAYHSLRTNIIKWRRAISFKNNQGSEDPRDQLHVSDQCCIRAES